MGAGAVIMGLLGLGLTLALASGRSKRDDEEPLDFDAAAERAGEALEKAGVPTEVIDDALSRAEETATDKKKRDKTPKPPPAAPSKDWRGWMATKLMHAMQSQSVAVMLATANELQTASKNRNVPQDVRSLMIQAAAALRAAANDLKEKAKPPPSPVVKTIPELKPKRRPKAKRKKRKPKPKPIPEPELDTSGPTEEQLAAIDFTNRKTGAMKLNQHLKSVKKGSEDRDMVEEYQEQEGLEPDGKYGVETAKSLIQFNVVPAKPFYVGDAGNWQSYVDDKKDWNTTVDRMAAKDSDRRGQWLATKL